MAHWKQVGRSFCLPDSLSSNLPVIKYTYIIHTTLFRIDSILGEMVRQTLTLLQLVQPLNTTGRFHWLFSGLYNLLSQLQTFKKFNPKGARLFGHKDRGNRLMKHQLCGTSG